jgi:hyaluronoglucosaminidase
MTAVNGPVAGPTSDGAGWLAVIEGFYGPPLRHEERLDLLRWAPAAGFTDYAYGPKDDAFHRAAWREPYPAEHLDRFAETLDVARAAGVELTLSVSPGLDWQGDADHAALVAKLRQLHEVGVRSLGVYWDDVPPGGADLGRSHGAGVAAAMRGLPDDVRWLTCGTDYATAHVTDYLSGFAAALPAEVAIAWTGPGVTSPEVPAAVAGQLTERLGHPLLFCDNWPVNDLGMSAVLHLGPMPARDPALRAVVAGAGFNMMSLPLASRVGLELAARHWRDPAEDRELAWRQVVGAVPGLLPLARACRSWLTEPGPAADLVEEMHAALAGDDRLLAFLDAGCRAGLPPDWAAELEPWLAAWEAEARVIAGVLRLLRDPAAVADAPDIGVDWPALHRLPAQVFGIRFAVYGHTYRAGDQQLPRPDSVLRGENLTDLLIRTALEGLYDAARRTGTAR